MSQEVAWARIYVHVRGWEVGGQREYGLAICCLCAPCAFCLFPSCSSYHYHSPRLTRSVSVTTPRYEDNRTFDAAFQLLNRKYSERAHLVQSLANVVLLPHMSIPIFGNVATLQNHVGFLRFLVRSSEVWGVSSELSGPFNFQHFHRTTATLRHLVAFMYDSTESEYADEEQIFEYDSVR